MKVECSKCQKRYNINDSNIPEGGAKFKCKRCQHIISISLSKNDSIPENKTTSVPDFEGHQQLENKTKGKASTISDLGAGFAQKAKEKANLFKNTVRDKSNSYGHGSKGTGQTSSKLNALLSFSFRIGKYISAFCIVSFFMVFIGASIYYFTTLGSSFEQPTFNPSSYHRDKSGDFKSYSISEQNSRRKIEKKYDDQVKFIVQHLYKREYWDKYYDKTFDEIANIPENYRDAYANGLVDFIEDASNYYQNNQIEGKVPTFYEVKSTYDSLFQSEMSRAEYEKKSAKQKGWIILGVIGGCIFLFMVFLMMPILIKIEENTRMIYPESQRSPELSDMPSAQFNSHANKQSSPEKSPSTIVIAE